MTRTEVQDLCAALARQLDERQVELPTLPATACEVLALCQAPETDAARLAAAIHGDPALAANVLRVANSAAHKGAVPCASLHQAISRLGLRAVADLAVAVAVRERLFAGPRHTELLRRLWRHSVLTGSFAREIARAQRRNVDSAFLGGLLHDVGKAVLLWHVERAPEMAGTSVAEDRLDEALQRLHARAGVLLGRHFGLPDPILECIGFHHDCERAPRFAGLAMTVCLADLIAHCAAAGGEDGFEAAPALRQHPVLGALGLYPDQLDAVLACHADIVRRAEGLA